MNAVTQALWGLAPIAGAVCVVALFGRDPKADEHDLSDYHEPAPVNTAPRSLRHYLTLDEQTAESVLGARIAAEMKRGKTVVLTEGATFAPIEDDTLPPAPPGMNAGSPLWRALVIDTAVPTLSDEQVRAKANKWLREIRDEALAGAR